MIRVRKGRKMSESSNEGEGYSRLKRVLFKFSINHAKKEKVQENEGKNRLLFTFLDLKRAHSSWLACKAHIIHK